MGVILGIDPGLRVTGYGVVDSGGNRPRLIEAGIVKSTASHPLERRLRELYEGIVEIIAEFPPEAMAVEELYSNYKHPRTAVIMGHARGLYFLAAAQAGVPVFSYSATRIKKSLTGVGQASKEQIARMIVNTLDCDAGVVRSDVTDAVAAALCHLNAVSRIGIGETMRVPRSISPHGTIHIVGRNRV